jgi:hypothetical protein
MPQLGIWGFLLPDDDLAEKFPPFNHTRAIEYPKKFRCEFSAVVMQE